ncbi:MAG: hypothetical protein Q9214_006257 [Letrouitia sp. 1 TL-2023]
MDAFSPQMHKFECRTVFRRLYREICLSAVTKVFSSADLAQSFCEAIEDSMEVQFMSVDCGFETAAQRHSNNLVQGSRHWNKLKSNQTCLFCLRRHPEYILTCEHAICETCVKTFGTIHARGETVLEISACFLCAGPGRLKVAPKPVTAGIRILSIDGGGVRGVVPLEFLTLLQDILGPELSVCSLFDQAFGTSSGLFMKHWDVVHCAKVFDSFTRKLFGIHLTKGRKFWTRFRDYFRCWLSDSCYSDEVLDRLLQEVFGTDRKIFDADPNGTVGCKVAVTATTISDASAFLFSNYNGSQRREESCGKNSPLADVGLGEHRLTGYKMVRMPDVEREPFIWEA